MEIDTSRSISIGDDDDADSKLYVGFRPAPSTPKLNEEIIHTKKSTTFIKSFDSNIERIRIENHVYTASIGRDINLRTFHESTAITHGGQLNTKKFAACVMRWRDPRIALLLFACGKIVCSGAKNRYQARLAIKDAVKIVRSIGYTDVDLKHVQGKLQNMVVSVKLKFGVNLDSLSQQRSDICLYQKEMFPGASLKLACLGSINVAVYSAGRLIITGAKDINDIKKSIAVTLPILMRHRKVISRDPVTKLSTKTKSEQFGKILDINLAVQDMKNKQKSFQKATPKNQKTPEILKEFMGFEEKQSTPIKTEDPLFNTSTTNLSDLSASMRSFLPISRS